MRIGKQKEIDMIRFVGRSHPRKGIVSTVIGIFITIVLCGISILSGTMRGQGGEILGLAGLGCLALSVFGAVLSYQAFQEKDIFYRFPVIGGVFNSLMAILLITLYILGIGL